MFLPVAPFPCYGCLVIASCCSWIDEHFILTLLNLITLNLFDHYEINFFVLSFQRFRFARVEQGLEPLQAVHFALIGVSMWKCV